MKLIVGRKKNVSQKNFFGRPEVDLRIFAHTPKKAEVGML